MTDQFLSVDPDVDETGQPYVFTNDDPLNSTDPLGQLGAGYPKADYKQELSAWKSGSASAVFGIALGILAAGAGVVVLAASAPEVVIGAAFVAGAAGTGAEALDAKKCLNGNHAACAGAILGLGGAVSSLAALGPEGSGLAIAAKAAGANFGIATVITDAIISLAKSYSAAAKPKKTNNK